MSESRFARGTPGSGVLRIFAYDIDSTQILAPNQIEDVEILFYHLSKDRPEIVKADVSP